MIEPGVILEKKLKVAELLLKKLEALRSASLEEIFDAIHGCQQSCDMLAALQKLLPIDFVYDRSKFDELNHAIQIEYRFLSKRFENEIGSLQGQIQSILKVLPWMRNIKPQKFYEIGERLDHLL